MAELPNFSAVACFGLKLSISLYEFTVSLGFASRELQKLGSDVAHFCSVLKQLQSVLRGAKSFKILPNTIQTTQDVLNKSQELFDEISAIISRLRKHDSSQVDLLKRVKWTFKKPKVLLLQEGLRSCDAMLHLMLTTMGFAQMLAGTKRYSRLDSNAEDEEQRALVHSLFLAQQSSIDRLEELEDECFLDDDSDTGSEYAQAASPFPFSPSSAQQSKRPPDQGVIDRSQSSQSFHPQATNSRRTSNLLNALLYQREEPRERKSFAWTNLKDHRQSVTESDNLLQAWTDQRDPLAWERASDNLEHEEEREKSWHGGDDLPYRRSQSNFTSLDTTNDTGDEISTSDKRNSLGLPEIAESTQIIPANHAEPPPSHQACNSAAEPCVHRSFRDGLEDTYRTTSPAVLRKHNIMEDWRDYLLYPVYMDGKRPIRLEEKPLVLSKELDKAGQSPTFMLRRKGSGPVDKRAEARAVQTGSDEGLPEVVPKWLPNSGDDLAGGTPKSDEGLPEVIGTQLQSFHPLPEPIQPHPHPAKVRSTEAFERSQQKLAKLTGLAYPIADAPELVETLSEINQPLAEALHPYAEQETPLRPVPIKARSSEAVKRSQQKLAKLTGLSYIPQGGDASLEKPWSNSAGPASVNRSAIFLPSRDLDTFDRDGALLHKWFTPPSAAQYMRSESGLLPVPGLVPKLKRPPWGS